MFNFALPRLLIEKHGKKFYAIIVSIVTYLI